MEQILDTSKGLHQDFDPVEQPAGTYTHLLNGIRKGSGSIENERGTELSIDTWAGNKRVVGGFVLDTDMILALYPSEIGILDVSENYTTKTTNTALNYQDPATHPGYKVDITAQKNFKSEIVIYTADGFNPDRAINLSDPTILASPNFGDFTQLQLNPTLPTVSVLSVTDQGSLPTGVYQFAARLLTKSTNSTVFSELTPLVPIIDGTSQEAFESQDGALPQSVSVKAINLSIDNIDLNYSYIEIVALTYVGLANVSSAHIVARLPINGKTSINFTYNSTDQDKESVSLDEITILPVNYSSSKSIEQKDRVLVRSNLTAEDNSFDFQLVANAVKLKYFIEEIPWQVGYKNAIIAALKKGYRRNEVYSWAIVPDYKSKGNSTAYHVAGTLTRVIGKFQPNNPGQLGTYTSTENYPTGRNYPIIPNDSTHSNGEKIRHHLMPTISQEPHFINRGGQIFIRILGVEADFTDALPLIPANILSKLNKFILVRQQRKDVDKSVLAQGIGQAHYRTTNINALNNNLAQLQVIGWPNYGNTAYIPQTNPIGSEVGFFSPETIIYQKDIAGSNLRLEPQLLMTGTNENRGGYLNNMGANVVSDYDNWSYTAGSITPITISPGSPYYVPAQVDEPGEYNVIHPSLGLTIRNRGSNGYLFFTLWGGLPDPPHPRYDGTNPQVDDIPEFFLYIRTRQTISYLNGSNQVSTASSVKYLHNITRDLSSQYGSLTDATYIYVGNLPLSTGTTRFFGGDTFIGKFAYMSTSSSYTNIPDQQIDTTVKFKNLVYYFVESDINVNYRHSNDAVGTESTSTYIPGTLPYYPKYQLLEKLAGSGTLGLFDFAPQLGHARGYNKQYSFESNIFPYFSKQLTEEIVTNFENRSIYSEQGVEGEQLDSFRIFLPNNYHDLPRDRGPIIDTFVHSNDFYHQTTGATYKSYFNEKVTQASSIGQVYIGTGGIFDRPSSPILTVNGGYGGTQGKWGVETPWGYLFIDARQKKVFLLNDKLEELSEVGMSQFFSTMEETDQFAVVYDYEQQHDRFIIASSKGWTISYQRKLNSWTSFHSYNPYFMISRGKSFYSAKTNLFYKHGNGPYSQFYGVNYPFEFEYSYNQDAKVTKSIDNLILHTNVYEVGQTTGIQPYKTFNQMRVYNELKDTSTINLIVPRTFNDEWIPLGLNETFAKFKNQEYRIAVTKDLLINPLEPGIYDTTRDFRPRMTGKWAKIRFIFNTPLHKFVLHTIETIARPIAR